MMKAPSDAEGAFIVSVSVDDRKVYILTFVKI